MRSNRAAALATNLGGRIVIRIFNIHPKMTIEGLKEVVRGFDEVAKEEAGEI